MSSSHCYLTTVAIAILGLFSSCQQPVKLSSLKFVNGLYVDANNEIYSGKVVSEFSPGVVSFQATIKHGIPDGQYYTYGFNGEVVQEGAFKVAENCKGENIYRVQKYVIKEGEFISTYYVVVTQVDLKPAERDAIAQCIKFKYGSIEVSYATKEL